MSLERTPDEVIAEISDTLYQMLRVMQEIRDLLRRL